MSKRKTRTIAFCMVVLVGLVLIWRGVWEISERFFGPEISILLGLVLLTIVGVLSREFLFEHI